MIKEHKLEEDVKALKAEVNKLTKIVDNLVKKLSESEKENSVNSEKFENRHSKGENSDSKSENNSVVKESQSENHEADMSPRTLDEIIKENSEKSKKAREKCDQCEYETSSDRNMKIHKAREHTLVKQHGGFLYGDVRKDEDGGIRCNICELRKPTYDEMRNHQREDHGYIGENVIKNGFIGCSTSRAKHFYGYR